MFDSIASWLSQAFGLGMGVLNAVLSWVWALPNAIMSQVVSFAMENLPADWVSFLNDRPWMTQIGTYARKIDYLTGCYSCFAVCGVSFTIVGGIRLVRWGLALIPRVFTGVS